MYHQIKPLLVAGEAWPSVYLGISVLDVFEEVARAELIRMVRGVLTEDEFALLSLLAQGKTYRDLAAGLGISVTNAKSKVFRVRKRVGASAVGLALRSAFP